MIANRAPVGLAAYVYTYTKADLGIAILNDKQPNTKTAIKNNFFMGNLFDR